VDHIGDLDWETDLARLRKLSPEFEQLWSKHEVADGEPRLRRIMHPVAGELSFTATELSVPAHPDLILFVETPADTRTRERLHLTRREPAEV
jgi:hypothetical protein